MCRDMIAWHVQACAVMGLWFQAGSKPAVVAGQSATMTIERKDVRGNW